MKHVFHIVLKKFNLNLTTPKSKNRGKLKLHTEIKYTCKSYYMYHTNVLNYLLTARETKLSENLKN